MDEDPEAVSSKRLVQVQIANPTPLPVWQAQFNNSSHTKQVQTEVHCPTPYVIVLMEI